MSKPKFSGVPAWMGWGMLWVLLLSGFAVLVVNALFWWQEYRRISQPPATISSTQPLDNQQKMFQAQLDAYKAQADDLEKLISLLIGLSSLYALVLGVGSYLSAQQFIERSRDNSKTIEEYVQKLQEKYTVYINFGGNIDDRIEELNGLLPGEEERDAYYAALTPRQRQRILSLEVGVAFLDYLSLPKNTAAVLYHKLGMFYSGRYSVDLSSLNKFAETYGKKALFATYRNQWSERNQEYAERAYMYLLQSVSDDPKDFAARNDLALALIDIAQLPVTEPLAKTKFLQEARGHFEESLRLEPRQQRARYNLARFYFDEARADGGRFDAKKLMEAEKCLTRALMEQKWQKESKPLRVKDTLYNRACYRSRLGEATGDPSWLPKVTADLETAFREGYDAKDVVREDVLKAIRNDQKENEDLNWFDRQMPSVLDKIIAQLEAN